MRRLLMPSVPLVLALLPAAAPERAHAPLAPNTFTIPLRIGSVGSLWGPDRNADHATVAVNARGDVAIAYHSTRNGFPGAPYPLKQVELAIYTAQPGGGWTMTQQDLLGAVQRSPLHPALAQTVVRCERPDIVAVGERFFVVWTRRYDRAFPGQQREPAVLECAWLEWNGARYDVLTGGQPVGQGYPLDSSFTVRECAGVADAVALDVGSPSAPARAAVVYAHQTDFGDDPLSFPPLDGTRKADLRIAVATIDAARLVAGGVQSEPLVRDVPYDGEPQPLGGSFPALYLPDCAPGLIPDRFWMAYQEQHAPISGTVPDGRVRLTICEPVGGSWAVVAEEVVGDPQHPAWRHRAAVDSRPEVAGGLERVSFAHYELTQPNDADVRYGEWNYAPLTGITPVAWPSGAEFPNAPNESDTEPVPLHGTTQPLLRRCYHGHDANVDSVRYYDVDDDRVRTVAKTPRKIARPAVDLGPVPGGGQVIATTWESVPPGGRFLRIMLSLEQ